MPRLATPSSHPATQAGFSLIELMVAVAIGMVAVIVMMTMLTNSDTAKRITVGGNDAQMSGTLALYNLERDIRMSGYGTNSPTLIDCELTLKTTEDKATVKIPFVPVLINPMKFGTTDEALVPVGDTNSDILLVIHGSADESADGDALTVTTTADTYTVTTKNVFRTGQYVIAQSLTPTTPCAVKSVEIKAASDVTLTVGEGEAGIQAGGVVYNVGVLTAHVYAVRNGALTMCDFARYDCTRASLKEDPNVWEPVAGNVVALRAQYGRDLANLGAPMTGTVTKYDQARPRNSTEAVLTPECAWARTLSVRIGLVARGNAFDKGVVTAKAPSWSGAVNAADNPTPLAFDLSKSDPSDGGWKNFRYQTFETTIPVRNSISRGGSPC